MHSDVVGEGVMIICSGTAPSQKIPRDIEVEGVGKK
jgi:hypothetical protein